MRRIIGALSGLTVMVILSAALADDPRDVEAEQLIRSPLAQLTPEQHELANEVLGELGWNMLSVLQEFVIFESHAVDDAASLEEIFEENLSEFREMFQPELLFLRKTCELSEAEFQTLSQSCEASLREVTRQFLEEQNQESEDDQKPNSEPKPLPQRIQEAVSQIAECQLTREQWSCYSAELRLRAAHRKRVAILNLVSRLDNDLRLSSSQREQFAKLLEANWKEVWSQSLGAFANESNFMPSLPENEVLAILSPTQRAALAELQYDDQPDVWGDGANQLFLDVDEAVMAEDEAPTDGNAPQEPNALGSDQ